jgi:hypothetical protein
MRTAACRRVTWYLKRRCEALGARSSELPTRCWASVGVWEALMQPAGCLTQMVRSKLGACNAVRAPHSCAIAIAAAGTLPKLPLQVRVGPRFCYMIPELMNACPVSPQALTTLLLLPCCVM